MMSVIIGEKSILQTSGDNSPDVSLPVVSVIIPAYNCADFICETVDSIFAQEFKDYELIIVNDGSPDTEKLEEVISPYKDKIIYIKQENAGPAAARNCGIKKARGEYVGFVDSDDLWLPNFLSEQVGFMRANIECDLVYADALLFGDPAMEGKRFTDFSPSKGEVNLESLLALRCNIITSGVVAKKQTLIEGGLFDEAHGLRSEDYEFWMRLAKRGAQIKYQRQPLLRYRYRENSLSSDNAKLYDGALKALDKIEASGGLNEKENAALKRTKEKLNASKNLENGKQKLFKGDYKSAMADFKLASKFEINWKLKATLFGLRFMPNMTRKIYLKIRK